MAKGDQIQDTYSCTPLIIQLQMACTFANSLQKIWIHLCSKAARGKAIRKEKLISTKQLKNSLLDKLLNMDIQCCGKIKTLFLLF